VKYSVQLTSTATGDVEVVDVEASSEAEAMKMFDTAKFEVSVLRPDEVEQSSRKRAARMREQANEVHQLIQRGLVLELYFAIIFFALVVGCGLSTFLGSLLQQGEREPNHSEPSDAEKMLRIEVLRER